MLSKPAPPANAAASAARTVYRALYTLIAVLFGVCACGLVVLAVVELVKGAGGAGAIDVQGRFSAVLEAVGMLTVGVASLELSQTVVEEEIQRDAAMSTPTRARRFLSRFMIVIVVALGIESLIATFQFVHKDPGRLPHAAAIALGAAALLSAWGVFVRFNRAAEELEPEAMARVKEEDNEVAESNGDAVPR